MARGTTAGWRKARQAAFALYGDACVRCGDKATDIDHIVEVAKGGTDELENLQPLCRACHNLKTGEFNSTRVKNSDRPFFLQSVSTDRKSTRLNSSH